MLSWGDSFRLLLCISLTMWSLEASAQDGLRDIQQRFQEDVGQRLDSQQSQIDDIKAAQLVEMDLLKQILAQQSAKDALDMYGAQPEQLEKLLPAKREAVDKALKLVSDLPDQSIPDKAGLVACINAVITAGKAPAKDGGASAVAACPNEAAQKLMDGLAKQRDDATKTWTSCVRTLKRIKEFQDINLPTNPIGLSPEGISETEQAIKAVREHAEKTAGPAKDCVDGIEDTFDKIQNAESAASALSSALSLAGSVCLMSGGNPYVCGAIFVVAMLMSLFDNKGGGNGDKTGDSTDDVGNRSAKAPKCTKDCGEKKNPSPAPDGFVKGLGGNVLCKPVSKTAVDCFLKDAPKNTVRVDTGMKVVPKSSPAENALNTQIAAKDFSGFRFCESGDPAKWLRGIFVPSSGGKVFEVGLEYSGAEPSLVFNDEQIISPKQDEMSAACGAAFP